MNRAEKETPKIFGLDLKPERRPSHGRSTCGLEWIGGVPSISNRLDSQGQNWYARRNSITKGHKMCKKK